VGSRAWLCGVTLESGTGRAARCPATTTEVREPPKPPPLDARDGAASSTTLSQVPHSVQRPSHFANCAPHCWQTKTVRARATRRPYQQAAAGERRAHRRRAQGASVGRQPCFSSGLTATRRLPTEPSMLPAAELAHELDELASRHLRRFRRTI